MQLPARDTGMLLPVTDTAIDFDMAAVAAEGMFEVEVRMPVQ